MTGQRRAILRVLFAESEHVTADELVGRVNSALPDVHVATVYRFLDVLEQLGLVTHVHLGHGAAAYHLTTHRHVHVLCDRCGQIGVIRDGTIERWSAELRAEIGFQLTDQHFAFAGRCAGCSGAVTAG